MSDEMSARPSLALARSLSLACWSPTLSPYLLLLLLLLLLLFAHPPPLSAHGVLCLLLFVRCASCPAPRGRSCMRRYVAAHRHADDAADTAGEWSAAAKGGAGSAILSDEADIAAMPSGWQEEADEHIEALQQTLQQLQSELQ